MIDSVTLLWLYDTVPGPGCLENTDLENADHRPQTSKTQTSKTQTSKTQTLKMLSVY